MLRCLIHEMKPTQSQYSFIAILMEHLKTITEPQRVLCPVVLLNKIIFVYIRGFDKDLCFCFTCFHQQLLQKLL